LTRIPQGGITAVKRRSVMPNDKIGYAYAATAPEIENQIAAL
jgi:hypothetical protein